MKMFVALLMALLLGCSGKGTKDINRGKDKPVPDTQDQGQKQQGHNSRGHKGALLEDIFAGNAPSRLGWLREKLG